MRFLRRYPATLIALLLSLPLIISLFIKDFDPVDLGVTSFARISKNKIDEVVVTIVLLFVGALFDLLLEKRKRKRQHEQEIEAQRLRVLKATMTTVHDIVNNFLNNLQLFRMEAEGAMPEEELKLFDELIHQTAGKLKLLGDLESVPEWQMSAGTGIDYEGQSR